MVEGFLSVIRRDTLVSLPGKSTCQDTADDGFIINDEDPNSQGSPSVSLLIDSLLFYKKLANSQP